ncbi:hypothetical protein [Moraxella nonliquefaciens]|uniref:hypothetical protein n=1 Tax=Moraxella nonliquefaciens TaxID=478 RepID=UPI000ACFBD67|nr:hypothetical protein [Moraxella nonliquefaciens]
MKKLSILALSATVAITPAYAETTTQYNTPSTELSTNYLPNKRICLLLLMMWRIYKPLT